MQDSGIVSQVVKIEKVNYKAATHFVLCNGTQLRYLIDLHGGKKRLSNNISTYSKKLGLLMRFMDILPLSLLCRMKLGYFVKAELHAEIEACRENIHKKHWNMIIGTYDEKQKVVLQCFNNVEAADFVKVGNAATEEEMNAEISFLRKKKQYTAFDIPELLSSTNRVDGATFNIQVTKEFFGSKVEPTLMKEIVAIYQELSEDVQNDLAFSHGDFAPWNLKKSDNKYILFDWEHCGYRMSGFDLMHYCVVSRVMLEGKVLTDAIEEGLREIRQFVPDYTIDRERFMLEYNKLRLE